MTTQRLLTGFLACCLLATSACGIFSPTPTVPAPDGGLRTLVIPDDAEVVVDGVSMGPASQYRGHTYIPLKGGKHLVEIKKPGYRDYREEIFISGNLHMLTTTLKKEQAD